MKSGVILDTGPLVAFFSRQDRFHDWATQQLDDVGWPVMSCEAVITETCFLLARNGIRCSPVLELIDQGLIRLPFALEQDTKAVHALMDRFADVPMSLADACLTRMGEQNPRSEILTLDGGFCLYRTQRRTSLNLLIPDELRR